MSNRLEPSHALQPQQHRSMVDVGALVDGEAFADLTLAMACSSAVMVAASTAPVGLIPSSVWKDFRASVSAGVQLPSIGPSQNPPA